jgi:hypothetical protein
MMIPTAVILSYPRARARVTRTGTKGKYSSPNPIVLDPTANRVVPPATNQKG